MQGGASFEYQKGPDGKQYAVGGEVSIDTSEVPGDPEATIKKAETVQRAALAPANPSPQDRRVAAEASALKNKAQAEATKLKNNGKAENGNEPQTSSSASTEPLATGYTAKGNKILQESSAYTSSAGSMIIIA